MSNTRPQKIIVVLGREWRDGRFDTEPAHCLKEQINNTVIISTPDALQLNDEHMMDLMALTNPGPHLFLVRLEEGKQPEGELRKWEKIFGEDIFHNMRYITDGRYDDSRFPGKCINIKEDIIKQCEHIIKKDNHSTYSFGAFLKRRRKKIEYKIPAETETEQFSHHQDFPNQQDLPSRQQDVPSPVPGGQQKSPQLTLVLLGESGSGKSASGNTILGEKAFTSEPSSIPVTTECKMEKRSVCGIEAKVIDTPDFFDDSLQMPSRHIMECRKLCEGGLCVYLLVIQIGRFTEGERGILERLETALDTSLKDRAIILFTRGDDLKSDIDEYVRNTNQYLQQLIEKCGMRYKVFNNKITLPTLVTQQPNEKGGKRHQGSTSNYTSHKREVEKQVKELMGKIAELVQMTDGVKVFLECDAPKNPCVIA